MITALLYLIFAVAFFLFVMGVIGIEDRWVTPFLRGLKDNKKIGAFVFWTIIAILVYVFMGLIVTLGSYILWYGFWGYKLVKTGT